MSGGHFDYSHMGMEEMAHRLRIEIEHNTEPNGHGYCPNYPADTLEQLRTIQFLLAKVAVLAKDTDYLYSGDIGDHTFGDRVRPQLGEIRGYLCCTRQGCGTK